MDDAGSTNSNASANLLFFIYNSFNIFYFIIYSQHSKLALTLYYFSCRGTWRFFPDLAPCAQETVTDAHCFYSCGSRYYRRIVTDQCLISIRVAFNETWPAPTASSNQPLPYCMLVAGQPL